MYFSNRGHVTKQFDLIAHDLIMFQIFFRIRNVPTCYIRRDLDISDYSSLNE